MKANISFQEPLIYPQITFNIYKLSCASFYMLQEGPSPQHTWDTTCLLDDLSPLVLTFAWADCLLGISFGVGLSHSYLFQIMLSEKQKCIAKYATLPLHSVVQSAVCVCTGMCVRQSEKKRGREKENWQVHLLHEERCLE